MSGDESGIKIYGEQRRSAVADYDQDGRIDLLVTQNRGTTQLFHNETAKPGLRVRLNAIGTTIRLKAGEKFGPAREIHQAGVQVMSMPEPPTHVWVRWPGGKTTLSQIPAGAKEITVDATGNVK